MIANENTIVMEIPENELHGYISVNPINAEEMMRTMSQQTAMMIKHIEMLKNVAQ